MTLERGTLFDPKLVTDLISKVTGKSSLAALSKQTPIPFNGQKTSYLQWIKKLTL